MSIKNVIEDVKSLRGANVRIFGQPTILNDTVDDGLVDVLDVLDALESYEVKEKIIPVYDDDGTLIDELDVYDIDEYLDYLEGAHGLKEEGSDNTYNWGGNVSNDFYFHIYRDLAKDTYLVKMAVHRYGDVRANYTEEVLLEFDYMEEFYEALLECSASFDLPNDLYATVKVISEDIIIYDSESGDDVETVYSFDDAVEFAKNYSRE